MKVSKLLSFAAAMLLTATPALADGYIEYCENKDKSAEVAYTLKLIEDYTDTAGCKDTNEALKNIDAIGLNGPDLVDVKALSFFDNLLIISLVSDKAIDVTPLKPLTKLEELVIDAPIKEITSVPENVKLLHLLRIEQVNFAPETTFKNLEDLAIYNGKVSSFEFLKNAPALAVMAVVSLDLTTLDVIPSIKDLRVLELRFNRLTSLQGIERFPNLKILDIDGNAIPDIQPLKALPQLEVLGLANNPITAFDTLKLFANLEVLLLEGLNLKDVPDLGKKDKLKLLTLSDNSLTDISSLGDYPSLTEIFVNGNKLTEVDVIGKLTKLKRLWISGNAIKEIRNIPASMVQIDSENNGMTSLEWFKGQELPEFALLNVSHNEIEDLTPLRHLTGIYDLSVIDNKLRSLEGVEALTELEHLEANDNKIEDLTAIAEHTILEHVFLNGNQIKDVSVLGNNGAIVTIELNDNPLGTTIAKTDENCPTSRGPEMLQKWCRIKSVR